MGSNNRPSLVDDVKETIRMCTGKQGFSLLYSSFEKVGFTTRTY